jgi:hypothetical protein
MMSECKHELEMHTSGIFAKCSKCDDLFHAPQLLDMVQEANERIKELERVIKRVLDENWHSVGCEYLLSGFEDKCDCYLSWLEKALQPKGEEDKQEKMTLAEIKKKYFPNWERFDVCPHCGKSIRSGWLENIDEDKR